MDLNNLANVDFQVSETKGYSNLRENGVLHMSKVNAEGVSTTKSEYNRLQPLKLPFGTHLPPTADREVIERNGQVTIAWAQMK